MRGIKAGISLGAILVVLLFGIAYMSFGVLRFNPLQDFTHARMLLTNSGGIAQNSPVLLTGVEVGKVTDVRKVAAGVEVEFRVDQKYKIPSFSNVRIENLSALGEPHIEFEPTGKEGPYLGEGQLIETRNIEQPVSIPQLSARVVELVNQLDPKTISSLVDTVTQGLAGTEAVLPTLERASKLLAATILSRSPATKKLLIDLQAIGGDISWVGTAFTESGPQWAGFGALIDNIINKSIPLIEYPGTPEMYLLHDGLVPVLARTIALLNKVGPSIAELHPVIQPLFNDAMQITPQLDISTLISQAVNTVGDDGAVHLQINMK